MDKTFLNLLNSQHNPNSQQESNLQNYQNISNFQQLPSQSFSNLPNYIDFSNPPSSQMHSNMHYNSQNIPRSHILINVDNTVDLNDWSSNPSQIRVEQSQPSLSQAPKKQTNAKKRGENKTWREKEDEALMSAWCFSSTNAIIGKNQSTITRWAKVVEMYEQARSENPNEIGARSEDALKCRFKKLNEMANKWISCYKEMLSRPRRSGTNDEDVENEAQKLFEADNGGARYADLKVFKNVMCKHRKWSIENINEQQVDFTSNEELTPVSGGSSKRSRMNESDTPPSVNVSESSEHRPEGRDAAKKKRKGKAPAFKPLFNEDFTSKLHDMQISRDKGINVMEKKIEIELEMEKVRHEIVKKKEEGRNKRSDKMVLNTLLGRNDLSPDEEELKQILIKSLYKY